MNTLDIRFNIKLAREYARVQWKIFPRWKRRAGSEHSKNKWSNRETLYAIAEMKKGHCKCKKKTGRSTAQHTMIEEEVTLMNRKHKCQVIIICDSRIQIHRLLKQFKDLFRFYCDQSIHNQHLKHIKFKGYLLLLVDFQESNMTFSITPTINC